MQQPSNRKVAVGSDGTVDTPKIAAAKQLAADREALTTEQGKTAMDLTAEAVPMNQLGVQHAESMSEVPPEMTVTNNVLRALVQTMIDLQPLIKEKKDDLKKLNKAYKTVQERVKNHMKDSDLRFIDMPSHQVHTYSRIRAPAMNTEFISDGLKEYFLENNIKRGAHEKAAAFLTERRKDKVGGSEVWSITMRALKPVKAKAKAKAAGRGTKRKCEFVDTAEVNHSTD
jgi:hypothetical protein